MYSDQLEPMPAPPGETASRERGPARRRRTAHHQTVVDDVEGNAHAAFGRVSGPAHRQQQHARPRRSETFSFEGRAARLFVNPCLRPYHSMNLIQRLLTWLLSPIALSQVHIIPNLHRRFGADSRYVRIDVRNVAGERETLLLTTEAYTVALNRAALNPEDL